MMCRIATAFLCGMLLSAASTHAAITNCTPTAGFTACKRITYSGGDQTFTVPTGITSIEVRTWGAAGGGANATWYTQQGGGAGGGFASGTVAVTPGQALTVVVGQGGIPNSIVTTYGGGGAGGNRTGNATAIGGSGGGYSGIFAGPKIQANARVIAGGGGGASPGADGGAAGAGGGGGTTGGQDALPIRSGRGGTGAAGGAAATGNSSCSANPTAGTALQGGNGGSSSLTQAHEGGGGGGGGYFGGGGGLCQSGSLTQNGGGGGGSSFTTGAGVTAGATTAGQNFLNAGVCAGTANSGGGTDPFYTAGIGQGTCYGAGGNGEVIIQYRIATLRVSKTTVGNAPAAQAFSFSGDNGYGSENLTIPANTAGITVTGAVRPLDNSNTITTVSETPPTGYKTTSINCTGIGAGSATYNLPAGSAQLNATATANSNDVTCAFINTKLPTVRISKISNGGTGTFEFSGNNGFGTDSIPTPSTATLTPGTTKILSDASTATTLTETPPSNFFVSGMSCTGLGSGSATYDVNTGTVLLDTNATAPGNTVECTYTNTLVVTSLSLLKESNTPGPVNKDDVIIYTFTVTNTGNRPMANVVINETGFNGSGGLPAAANESLFTDTAPTGDSLPGLPNDGVWQALGPGDVVKFTASYTVTQADIDNLQ